MSVEAVPKAAKMITPFRQEWEPTPLVTVNPQEPAIAAETIVARIRKTQRARGCGSYVYMNTACETFVISEDRPAATAWLRDKFGWLVGYYRFVRSTDPRIPTLKPSAEGIAEDLADQAAQMGLT